MAGNVHNDEENVDSGKCDSTIIGRTGDLDAMSEHNHKKLTKLKNVITVLYNLTCKFWETQF